MMRLSTMILATLCAGIVACGPKTEIGTRTCNKSLLVNPDGDATILMDAVPLEELVQMFAREANVNIIAESGFLENLESTVDLKLVPWQLALDAILKPHGRKLVQESTNMYVVVLRGEEPPISRTEAIDLARDTLSDIETNDTESAKKRLRAFLTNKGEKPTK